MSDLRTYLNVPYAQKDAAKALGARWDASVKKWYVPSGKDLALFSQWQLSEPPGLPGVNVSASKPARALKNETAQGRLTLPADSSFIAYDGDAPPWD